MEIILSLMITSTATFLMLSHPMSMGFNLLIQSMLIAILSGMFNQNFWYSYIIFLVMVGGMLVLFIYMTSIASNEKFYYSHKNTLMIFILMTISTLMIKSSEIITNINEMINSQMNNKMWMLSLTKFFNHPQYILTMSLMLYLFMALLAVVKITKTEYGALKSN